MEKRIILIALLVLVLAFSACTKADDTSSEEVSPESQVEEESIEEEVESQVDEGNQEFDFEIVKVDPDKIKVSDEIVHGFMLRDDEETKAGYTKESYHIAESHSYEDKWYREYEVLYPKFTDEINGDGAEKIKDFYEQKAQDETINLEEFFSSIGKMEELLDTASDKEYYYFKNYKVNYVGSYISVRYFSSLYTGGAHGSQNVDVDNFDINTGELLTLESIFGDVNDYAPVLNEKISAGLKEQNSEVQEIDIENIPGFDDKPIEPIFELTENGVNFIFNEYIVGPYSQGITEVEIPYAELSDILKIEIA